MSLEAILLQLAVAAIVGAVLGWRLGRTIEQELRIKTWFAATSLLSQYYAEHFGLTFGGLLFLSFMLLFTPFRWFGVPLAVFLLAHSFAYVGAALRLRGFDEVPLDHQPAFDPDEDDDETDQPT